MLLPGPQWYTFWNWPIIWSDFHFRFQMASCTPSQKYSDSTSSSSLTVKGNSAANTNLFLSDWSLLSYRLLSLFKIEFSAVLFDRPIINMTQHILYYLYERMFAFFAFTAGKCRYNRWLQFCSRKPQILKFQHAKRPIDSTLWHCWTHTHTHTHVFHSTTGITGITV